MFDWFSPISRLLRATETRRNNGLVTLKQLGILAFGRWPSHSGMAEPNQLVKTIPTVFAFMDNPPPSGLSETPA